jgi:hypothetical protein
VEEWGSEGALAAECQHFVLCFGRSQFLDRLFPLALESMRV